MSNFERKLSVLINEHSLEKHSNTPDFILARYLNDCLNAFNLAMDKRDAWEGRNIESVVQEVNDIKIDPMRSQ